MDEVVIGFGATGVGLGLGLESDDKAGGWALLIDSEAVAKSCSLGLDNDSLFEASIHACSKSLSGAIDTSRTLAPASSIPVDDESAAFDPFFCVNGR